MTVVSEKSTPQSSASSIEDLTLRVGEDRVFVRKAGKGPAVLLLHGGACHSSDWIETMVPLADRYSLYAPDLVGYGQSDKNREGYYLSDFAASIVELIRMLGLESLAVVGHSLGGRVALEIAFKHPELVRKLVLVDTAGFSKLARWGAFLGSVTYSMRRILHRPQPYPRFLSEDGKLPDWLCLNRLPELKMPSLIVWNRRDPYYSVEGAIEAKKLMPHAKLEIMPGYGHAPHRTERDSFNRILANFLVEP